MHYYQFNIGDYMKSTRHLSIIEDIAYRRLLDRYYYTEKPLDLNIDKLVRLIGLKDHKTETQQILSEFFNETKKGFIQKRVQRELVKYSAKATAARENGKLGGRPKKTQSVNSANPDLTKSKAKQEPRTKNHKPKIKTKASPFIVPESINNETWKAFIEHRRKVKAPMTERAKTLIIGKLKKLSGDPNDILNQSIVNGWKGVFDITGENKNGTHQQNHKPSLAERVTENRKQAEQQIDEQSLGEDGAHIWS